MEDPIGNESAAKKEAGRAHSPNLCFLAIFKRSFQTLPNIFRIYKCKWIGGQRKYFWRENTTCIKLYWLLSKIYKSVKDPEIFTIFSILLLIMPIFANIFPVDWYHLQEYNIVHFIEIIKYTVILWLGVKICHFVRRTQTTILASSTRVYAHAGIFPFSDFHLLLEIPLFKSQFLLFLSSAFNTFSNLNHVFLWFKNSIIDTMRRQGPNHYSDTEMLVNGMPKHHD